MNTKNVSIKTDYLHVSLVMEGKVIAVGRLGRLKAAFFNFSKLS
jgi:hypothetical protein